MNTSAPRIKAVLISILSLLIISDSMAESPGEVQHQANRNFDLLREAPEYSEMAFSVIVFNDVGWSKTEVERVITEARQIYAKRCRFSLRVRSTEFITVDSNLHRLNDELQEQFLAELGEAKRPIVFFVGDTREPDFAAYAYLEGTISPSQGTAWLTRRAAKECRGPMLAHELGHIALNMAKHASSNNNLMAFSCQRSNISRQPVNTDMTPEQCETLWRRYTQ
jgi:hypothetical protein